MKQSNRNHASSEEFEYDEDRESEEALKYEKAKKSGIDPTFSFLSQPRLLRGLFGIILISTLTSLFEIFFYLMIVYPQTKTNIDALVKHFSDEMISSIDNESEEDGVFLPIFLRPDFEEDVQNNNYIKAYLATMSIEEEKLTSKVNLYAYLSMGVVILLLCILLYFIYNKLYWQNRQAHILRVFGGELTVVILSSLVGVIALSVFQVAFYFFGTKFKYTGAYGQEELVYIMTSELRRKYGFDT